MTETIDALTAGVAAGGVVVLSGAGLSTESGIPDYRGPSGAARRHTPMTYQAFVGDPDARRRYWARSHLGWRTIARAAPNDGHRAVARLQAAGLVDGVVTQNVDGLHTAAGSRAVVELHGRLDEVVCLDCGNRTSREELDRRLGEANPGFDAAAGPVNPDGDVELDDARVAGFRVVDCTFCGTGRLKPDVVFFGETVPAQRVARCFAMVGGARLLLVLGSSLTVLSGRRFVLRAAKLGVPVAIVNQGATRGDGYAALRVDAPLGRLLPAVADRLAAGHPGPLPAASVR
ncbi:NAD-dependent protein deacetylase [Micromonospora sp. NPDC092111]|uniref:NAD-dependent protein deacetylase n=1 Tax=Micromonospora sp. NPDC092111 TaxID=3364289 RepID=UPI0037F8C660